MTIDVLVEGWHQHGSRVREYFDEGNPGFSIENFRFFSKDEAGRPYQEVFISEYPSLNCTVGTLSTFIGSIAPGKDPSSDELSRGELPEVRRRLIRLVNTDQRVSSLATSNVSHGRLVECGVAPDRIVRNATAFLEVVTFAMDKDLSVYWG